MTRWIESSNTVIGMSSATAELADLLKFKENFERMEKEYIQFKNDYEITKRSQETLQDELKKTKERFMDQENEVKTKDRAFRDLTDKLKDYEIKFSLKESQIQDLEARVARSAWQTTNEELSVQIEEETGPSPGSFRDKVESEARDAKLETMVQQLNSLTQTIENQKLSHSEQVKKLTEKIEELRKENSSMKKENEGLQVRLSVVPTKPVESSKPGFDFPKDELSIMNEILQKSLELEGSVAKYKLKSEELAHQLLRDREHYNLSLGILYSVAVGERRLPN
jgi:DNA repair exonuclease SbcCD ATPase subunit